MNSSSIMNNLVLFLLISVLKVTSSRIFQKNIGRRANNVCNSCPMFNSCKKDANKSFKVESNQMLDDLYNKDEFWKDYEDDPNPHYIFESFNNNNIIVDITEISNEIFNGNK